MSSWFRDARDAKSLTLAWKNEQDNCANEDVKCRFSQYINSKIETAIIAGYNSVVIFSPDFLYGDSNIENWFMKYGGDDILLEIADELRERGYQVGMHDSRCDLLNIRW